MAVKIDQFIALQEVDRRIRSCQRDLEDLPRSIERSQRKVDSAKAELQAHHNAIKELRKQLDSRELDVRQIEDQIHKYEVQLNSVKTNKEFSALQHEIAGAKADRERIEDGSYLVLEAIDAKEGQTPGFQAKVQAAEKELQEIRQEAEAAIAERKAELEHLQKDREQVRSQIDVGELLALYEKVRSKYDGEPMAILQGNVCQSCFMSVPPNVAVKVQARHAGVQCGSCGRLLYIP
ncbi:MAG: hypothetical protein RL885_11190 [Planctomycetota bacterium]